MQWGFSVLGFAAGIAVAAVAFCFWRFRSGGKSGHSVQESERMYRAVIDHSPSLIYMKDAESRLIMGNKGYREFHEITLEEMIGSKAHNWLGHEAAEKMVAQDKEIIADGRPKHQEFQTTDKSGAIRWVRSLKFPIFDDHGKAIGIGGFSTDVTDYKEAEIALRDSEQRNRELVEQLPDAVYLQSNGRIVFVNSAAVGMFRAKSADDLIGSKTLKLFHSDHWDAVKMAREEAATGNLEQPFREFVHRRLDGTEFYGEARGTQFTWDGKPARLVVVRDMTARKQTELALNEAKEAAEQANGFKSEFLASTSHEIRTPMNAVLGMTRLLVGTDLTATQLDYAEAIRTSGEALLAIINDILDLSKMEAGKFTLECAEFAVREPIDDVTRLLESQAREKGIELTATIAGDVPEFAVGDAGRLRQILINLVGNAIKFTQQGSVAIRVAMDGIDRGDRIVRFEVIDTGIGLSPDQQSRLFQRFAQATDTTAKEYGGTGLGLAISCQLCELMQGEIGVDSTQGKGSNFWFTAHLGGLREAEQSVETDTGSVPTSAVPRDRPGMRVLLAEDNAMNQKLFVAILSNRDYHVDVVGDGHQALEAVQKNTYDLVLMDVQMPRMDGITSTKAIRALGGTYAQMPIVAITANARPGDREIYLAAGMSDYVSKPVEPAELFAAVTRAVDGQGQPSKIASAG